MTLTKDHKVHKIMLLHIEDSPDYSMLFKLKAKGYFDITLCTSLEELKKISPDTLASFQITVCDGQLPDGTGMEALEYLKQFISIPCVGNSSSDEYNAKLSSYCKFTFNKRDLLNDKTIIQKCVDLVAEV